MADVGQLTVVLTAEDHLSGALRKVEGQLQDTHKAMLAVGSAMTAVGVAGVAAFQGAVAAAASFESAMAGVRAVLGAEEWAAFGAQLDALAMQLGRDTVFSAKEAAQAIEELSKAGVSAANILGGAAEAVTSLAAAGGVSIKEAAEIAANAANAFGLAGTDMAHTADVISGAVNASSIEMGDFRATLQQVGAAAVTAGQSFDETAVAIAAMGQAGVKNSDAGTSLRVMLTRLVPTTQDAVAAFQALGLMTAEGTNQLFTATGAAKSWTEMAALLEKAMAGLTDERRIALLHDAFGEDAARAASILGRTGAAGMEALATAMGKVSAQGVAATKLDNFAGAVKNLEGSVETLAITVGQRLTPALRVLAELVKGLVDGFMALPAGVQTAIVLVAGVATAVTGITGAVLAAQGALALLGLSFAGLAAAAAPLLLVVAGVTAAVAAAAIAWQNDWGGLRTETTRVVEQIAPVLAHLVEVAGWFAQGIGHALDTVGRQLQAFWTALAGESAAGADGLSSAGDQIIRWFHDDLVPAVDAALASWEAFWTTANDVTVAAVNDLLPPLRALSEWYHDRLAIEVDYALGRWTAFWDQVGPTITAAWAVAEPIFALLADGYRTLLGGALEAASAALSAWVENFKTGLAAVAAVLGPIAEQVGGKAAEINAALQRGLQDMAPKAAAATAEVTDEMLDEEHRMTVEVHALAVEVGAELTAGLIQGLAAHTPEAVAAIRAQQRALLDAAKAEAEIGSPSALFAREIGAPLAAGIGLGLRAGMGQVAAELADVIAALGQQSQQLVLHKGTRFITRDKFTGAPAYAWDPYGGLDPVEAAAAQAADALARERERSGRGQPFGGRGLLPSLGLGGGDAGGGTLLGGGGGAELVLTLQAATQAATAFLTVQDGLRTSAQAATPAVQALTDAYWAYTAAALGANSLTTRGLGGPTSSGMQAGLTGAQTYGNVGDPNYLAWLNAWQNGWNTPTGQVGTGSGSGNPYYPPVTVHIQTPPALITPTSDLELRATADKLAPLVADALQRSGRLGMG